MRMKLHYLVMMIIIPIYGIEVCPFIEKINPIEVYLTIASLLFVGYLVRSVFWEKSVTKLSLTKQVSRMFTIDISVFVFIGLLFTLYNFVVNEFPLSSGFKVMVGLIAMGLFASADSALALEKVIAHKVKQDELDLTLSNNYFPLTSKLALYSGVFLVLIVGVFTLLVIKDLDWLVSVEHEVALEDARISILKEFSFVLIVTFLESLNIVLSFSRNLNMFLKRENDVLIRVTSGFYNVQVPVSSNDEFGVMATHTNEMIKQIRERTDELHRTRDTTILTLASLAETRDNETGAHILRTQRYVKALAMHLKSHPKFSNELDDGTIDLLYKSAPLHDIGKVGIPDAILLKPGKLTDEEFEIMKQHATIGADALKVAEEELGSNSFLRLARTISLTHHEKWNGSGYPAGLCGDEIPVSGRLMALADVYDALITKRVYKPAFSHEKAMSIIHEGRGTHFDPDIVDALDAIEDQFISIANEFSDARYELKTSQVA